MLALGSLLELELEQGLVLALLEQGLGKTLELLSQEREWVQE